MSPEQQRIATMTPLQINDAIYYALGGKVSNARNYYGCLNAMHEAEKVLRMDQSYDYGNRLAQLVREPENIFFKDKPSKRFPLNGWGHFHVAHLTAAQRAEAFLKTIGKWEDA